MSAPLSRIDGIFESNVDASVTFCTSGLGGAHRRLARCCADFCKDFWMVLL